MKKLVYSQKIILKLYKNSKVFFILLFSFVLFLCIFLGSQKAAYKEPFSKEGQRELEIYQDGMNKSPEVWDLGLCIAEKYEYKGAYLANKEPVGKISPQYMIDGVEYAHPVNTVHYALFKYNKYIFTGENHFLEEFLDISDSLLEDMKPNGSLEYGFEYKDYVTKTYFKPGWISCMAQGEAISVYARAFAITRDYKYYEGAKKSYSFMFTPKEDGGCLATLEDLDTRFSNNIFLEEYITYPKNHYTLNGYMFSMIGVYDILSLMEEERDIYQYVVREDFVDLISTLKIVLPYYDLDNFSSYDLAHITMPEYRLFPDVSAKYHKIHICQLDLLYKVTGDKMLMKYRNKFINYVL